MEKNEWWRHSEEKKRMDGVVLVRNVKKDQQNDEMKEAVDQENNI